MFYDGPVKAVCDTNTKWKTPFIINVGEAQSEGRTFRYML